MDIIKKSWFIKYEPKNIEDVVFDREEDKRIIKEWLANKRIPGNVLFFGPGGVGKTATSRILIYSLIDGIQNNFYRMKTRSVKEIDDQLTDFLKRDPIQGKQKIVYIEEFDRISDDGLKQLKEDKLELFQDTTAFICCTNNINKFKTKDHKPLLSRFTTQMPFMGRNKEKIVERLEYILQQEQAEYNKTNLENFVEKNIDIGIRELINYLQLSYTANNGKIDFKNIEQSAGIEESIVKSIIDLLEVIARLDPKSRRMCCISPQQSSISTEYSQLCSLIHNNSVLIDYDLIYERLYNLTSFIPLKMIIAEYADNSKYKKFVHTNLLACIYEMMRTFSDLVM